MTKQTFLVFAPHPDDILGCAGSLAKQRTASIHVVVLSENPKVSQQQCLTGLAHLGIENVQFWDYPDSAIPLSGAIIEEYQRVVQETQPTHVLLPHPQESHTDHLRVTRGFLNALEGQWEGRLLFYETLQPLPVVNHLVDITVEFGAKLLAAQTYAAQLKEFDYVNHVQTLARLRGLHANVAGAEAFLLYEWDGSYQHFFENRPLISVIVRANDIDYLQHALKSLLEQSYEQFEVIIVWFGEQSPSLKNFDVLDIRLIPGKTSRTFNLNEGLRHARGEYIAFLDQDDVLYPQHLAVLLSEIHGHPQSDIVYSGCKTVACQKRHNRIKLNKVIEVMNQPWNQGRLLIGNFIPLHALLFRATVFHAHQFDETLDAYEDWELLIRLSFSHFNFLHLDEITCEYRIFSENENPSYAQIHQDKGYLAHRHKIISKLLKQIEVSHFEQIAEIVKDLSTEYNQLNQKFTEQNKQQDTQIQQLKQQLTQYQGIEQLIVQGCTDMGLKVAGRQAVAQLIGRALPQKTLFSIVLPVYNTEPNLLRQTLLSVRNQAYCGWELCIVDDASDREETQQVLHALQQDTVIAERLHYQRRETRGGIVAASNDAIKMATAPYIAFLDHDDRLHTEALLTIALKLQQHDYTLLYTDSRMIDHSGQLLHTYRKADWSPETLLHLNHINHLTVVKREILNELGGFRPEFDGGQDWDLLLELIRHGITEEQVCHVAEPLYDWRATEGSLAYKTNSKSWTFKAAMAALKSHLETRGLKNISIRANPQAAGCLPHWDTPLEPIDIIIPTHSNLKGLKTCVSGLLQQTDYPQFNLIIVANRCIEPIREYLETLKSQPQIKIQVNDEEFNWSRLNNQGVVAGENPLLLFLNDDVEITQATWLRKLARYIYLEGVGAVGATLFYPNRRLQHNGIETDPRWIGRNIDQWGEKKPLHVTRNVSAVTGACLLTQRQYWEQIGGFDEHLTVYYNDVDYCLGLRNQGLRIVQATDVELIHHEKATYGSHDSPKKQALSRKEINLMREKWGDFLNERYMPRYEIKAHSTRILRV
jgi:glycosyltransferase involved in cell wall biosynthesis/LmbE family N-acetylglucosaminyl deacetylase